MSLQSWWSNVTQANERTTDSLINEIEQGTMCNYLGALIGLVFVGMVLCKFANVNAIAIAV